jgi:integrase
MRGTVARAEIRRVLAATYHQVWWPDTSTVKYDGDQLPVWDEHTRNYLDPATGEVLPTWDQALDELGDGPHHSRCPVRCPVRRPGRARQKQGRGPVHRVSDQVLDQAGRRLPLKVLGAASHEWTAHDLVFTTRTGRPVEPRNLARSFHRIIASHGLRPIRLHSLRRTTATLLKDLGVPPRDTMEILGHARIAVTMEIYTGADDASRRVALSKLSALFGTEQD